MLDYAKRTKGKQWITSRQTDHAKDVQEWLWAVGPNPWIGKQYIVSNPDEVHIERASCNHHEAYVKIKRGDRLTCLSPPVWIWLDRTCMAGEWSTVAATYTMDLDVHIPMEQEVQVGLVPFTTLEFKHIQCCTDTLGQRK